MYRSWLALAVRVGLILTTVTAATSTARPAAPPAVALYLAVTLNGAPTGLIAAFEERPDGRLTVAPDELAALGILTLPDDVASDGHVALSGLAGVAYAYDAPTQTIRITTSIDRLVPQEFNAAQKPSRTGSGAGTLVPGAVLNYTLYGAVGPGDARQLSGLFDAWVFGNAGVFEQSGLLRNGGSRSALRLDTSWALSDPVRMLSYRAGDLVSGGLAWSRPIRMGGFQVARNFALRPDLVTIPLPSFSGSAALPSTVEIYANGARLFSADVAAGPFTVSDLSTGAGSGTALVTIRDALGRTTEAYLPFFTSPALLRAGLSDFSFEAGFPRRSYGVASADYASAPAASASYRRGLTDTLTLEAHGEATYRLVNGGVGVIAPVGPAALFSAALAASGGNDAGAQATMALDFSLKRARFHLSTTRALGAYSNVAAITALDPAAATVPRAIDQVSLTIPAIFGRGSLAVGYASMATTTTRSSTVLATYTQRLGGNGSLFAGGYYSLRGDNAGAVFLGLSRKLPGDVVVHANASPTSAGRIDVGKSERPESGGAGWQAGVGFGPEIDWRVGAGARTPAAHFAGSLRGTGAAVTGTGEVTGAVVVSGGDVFFANRIDDTFAVVDAGAPGVTVYRENRPVGVTDSRGKLLVAGLRAWQANRLAIDVNDLPPTTLSGSSTATVVPPARSGMAVDFAGGPTGDAALIVIRDAAGRFPTAGSGGRLNAAAEFTVGYDGQAFVSGLKPQNRITLALADGSACAGNFAFVPGPAVQQVINVACR